MLPVVDGTIDARVILGLGAAAENDLASRPSHHDGEEEHEHDDFNSVVIDLPEIADIDALVVVCLFGPRLTGDANNINW